MDHAISVPDFIYADAFGMAGVIYRTICNISYTKSQNLNDSRLV